VSEGNIESRVKENVTPASYLELSASNPGLKTVYLIDGFLDIPQSPLRKK
jgi:hypothetical protein